MAERDQATVLGPNFTGFGNDARFLDQRQIVLALQL